MENKIISFFQKILQKHKLFCSGKYKEEDKEYCSSTPTAPFFLIVANTGGCGNIWMKTILDKIEQICHTPRTVPGLANRTYDREKDLWILKLIEQDVVFRINAPLDCLFDEIIEITPNKQLYVLSHYHTAGTLSASCNRYPPSKKLKTLYTYGCPLKRFRADFKSSSWSIKMLTNISQHLDGCMGDPEFSKLVRKTEKKFKFTISPFQILQLAAPLYRTKFVVHDLCLAKDAGFYVENFEKIKTSPKILSDIFLWATDDKWKICDDLLAGIYCGSDSLGLNPPHIDYNDIDTNGNSIISAPYDSYAIWNSLNTWQKYFFHGIIKQIEKAEGINFIHFYRELGIDLSFLQKYHEASGEY